MPGEGGDYYSRLQLASEELNKARSEHYKLSIRRDELQKQIDGEVPTFGLLATPDKPGSEREAGNGQLEVYEAELASLLLKYTEKHPKVVNLQYRIDQLRSQRELGRAQDGEQPTYELNTDLVNMNSLDLNPVYQSLKIAIGQANADLSEMSAQVVAAESDVAYLRKMVDTIPEIEAQLARLNRDYEVNKTQHTALLTRLESARLSEEAEFRSEEIKFRIIEPPVVPLNPVGPSRVLFNTVVLIAGFICGGALALLLNLINPVFNAVEELRQDLGLPVIGSVSLFESESQIKDGRKSARNFGFATAALMAAYVLALFFWPAADMIKTAIAGSGATL